MTTQAAVTATRCPTCDRVGRKVKQATLESLLRPDRRADMTVGEYHVCTTPECETVYFGAGGGVTFTKSDLIVRFGLKEATAPRPVCYCFDHTVEEIHEEIHRTGESTVVDSIKADMKGPGCRCEYTNPLGGCCLQSVQAVVAEGFRRIGRDSADGTAGEAEHEDCCAAASEGEMRAAAPSIDGCPSQDGPPAEGSGRDRAGVLAAAGSVVVAVCSSACCWLPLILIAFGASAAGVAGFFEAYRPYFIVGAVVLLGSGFYTVYIRKEKCAPGAACTKPNRKLRTANQVMLWAATTLVAAFVFFPNYVGYLLGTPAAPSAATGAATDAPLVEARFTIEGMTCEGCAARLHNALAKLPDVAAVAVEYPNKTARVRYYADKPVPRERVIDAVKAAGYTATFAAEAPLGNAGGCCAPDGSARNSP